MIKNGCSHNWIHNAGKQCQWDIESKIHSLDKKARKRKGDSNNIAYMYICTMCGEEFWSSDKCLDITHYRVREVR